MLSKGELVDQIDVIKAAIATVIETVKETSGNCIKAGKAQAMLTIAVSGLETVNKHLSDYVEGLDADVE